MTTVVKRFPAKFVGPKFHEVSISGKSYSDGSVFYRRGIFWKKVVEQEERGRYFVGSLLYVLTLLGGISNWINNCLIPVSRLDLSGQTEEAVSYGKESQKKKEWEGREGERRGHRKRNTAQGTVF